MIYFDHAATTPLDGAVLEKMLPYLKTYYGNASSQHAFGRETALAVLNSRDKISGLIGCRSDEIYFVSGGTEAGNWALKGTCAVRRRGHLILSAIEHPALYESAEDMKKLGFDVTYVNPDSRGIVCPQSVKEAIRDDTVFCAVMHANNETGVIQPVKEIGEICRERGIFYYCDCVQTAGVLPLPVSDCNALGISAHKFYGPKGAGVLYLKTGSALSRFVSGGRQERGLRGGTVDTASVAGCAAALEIACENSEKDRAYVGNLRDYFLSRALGEIEGTKLNGDREKRLPSNANIAFDGCDGENILFLLDLKGIAVSAGSACSAGAVTPSRTLLAMGLTPAEAKSSVRFTFGKNNTKQEIDYCIEELKKAVGNIRKISH